jgi:uncharacterized protein (TIGR03083 family)
MAHGTWNSFMRTWHHQPHDDSGAGTRVSDQEAWADELDEAVRVAVVAMRDADAADWSVQAGSLEWDCRTTVCHIASDFVGYAGQLTAPQAHGYAPFDVALDGAPDPTGLRDVLRATGGMLSSVVRTAGSQTLSWHPYGIAGPLDFAAMGTVELLVHTEDLSRGLGFPWNPPDDLCERVLTHLFPGIAGDSELWPTLLWATGRIALETLPQQHTWRWENTGT